MRLLKPFPGNNSEPKSLGNHGIAEDTVKFGKRFELRDQLVELPIEHQIYDIIDDAGSEGLTMLEVCSLVSCLE